MRAFHVGPRHGSVRGQRLEPVWSALYYVQDAFDTRRAQAFGVGKVLVEEQLNVPGADPRRWKARQFRRRAGTAYSGTDSAPGATPR